MPRLGVRVLAGIGALAVLAAAALAAVIGVGTLEQDRAELAASTRLAETALRVRNAELGRVLRDYAIWPDALLSLHPTVDIAWLYDGENIGANTQESLGYEYAFVVDAAGRTIYAVAGGEMVEIDALSFVGHGLDRLVALARERVHGDARVAGGAVTVAGAPALASAAVIWPTDPLETDATPETAPVLVFIDMLDEETLDAVAASYLLHDLRFAAERGEREAASLPLIGTDGATLGWLSWRPDRPGTALLHAALPWLVAVGGTFGLLAALVARSLRRAVTAATASEERFRDVATSASDWIFEADRDLGLTYLSGRFAELTGLPVGAMLGRRLLDLVEPDKASAAAWAGLANGQASGPVRGLQGTVRDASGRRRTLRLTCRAVLATEGRVERFRGTASDVTDEIEARARAEFLSLHDSLTGLPNRLLFTERLEEAMATARREGRPAACLYLGLDRFKEVNDTLGHEAGDALLREVTARLRGLARETDTVARLGGDEFAILLAGCGDAPQADAFCRRALEAVALPFDLEGHAVHTRASLGVAFLPNDADDAERAMRCADLALFRAKTEGRGTYRFYAPEMNADLHRRRQTEQDLRRALQDGHLELHFQPKYRTEAGELTGFEALLRWRHPECGLVPPGEFIGVAEQSGLIVPIGEWILEAACAHAVRWPGLDIAVNLSPAQFKSPRLVAAVRRALELAGMAPGRLELEVTESLLVQDLDDARAMLLELKELGVKLALDDFGTGYSSLAYLHSLPFDRIKIDRSFVARLGVSQEAEAIVRAVVTLGQGLGMATTAEGVESPTQLEFLRAAGCGEVQGYLLGRPMPAEATNGIAHGAAAARSGRAGAGFHAAAPALPAVA